MIKAIVFDFDGVLVESEPHFLRAEVEIFKSHGIPLTYEVASKYLGLKIDAYISMMEKVYRKTVKHKQVAEEIEAMVKKVYEQDVQLVEGVAPVLPRLAKSYKIALATSREKHLAQMLMKRHGIAKFFEKGVYREDVTIGKPDPEVFSSAAKLLGLEPSECAAVEDAQAGFEAGSAAGMRVIGRQAEYNKYQDFKLAELTFADFSELPGILASL